MSFMKSWSMSPMMKPLWLVDEGGDHVDLAFLGPGDKRVLFVCHKTQQY